VAAAAGTVAAAELITDDATEVAAAADVDANLATSSGSGDGGGSTATLAANAEQREGRAALTAGAAPCFCLCGTTVAALGVQPRYRCSGAPAASSAAPHGRAIPRAAAG